MLYVSTRNHIDSFTAYRTLHEDRAPDGGMFVPIRFPKLSAEEIDGFKNGSFGETVAFVLNLFFSTDLIGWDIDSCVGRYPYKLIPMSHKLIVSELWHNHEADYNYLERQIYKKLTPDGFWGQKTTCWAKIAIRIAVICAIWGEIMAQETSAVDVALMMDDISAPMSVWYAKKMGLPIGRIICAGQDNGLFWDLVHRGEINASAQSNSVPGCAELLIYDVFGLEETKRFVNACDCNRSFRIDESEMSELSEALFVSVIGTQRIESLISSIYRSCGYAADDSVALGFGGLQNYRAQTGCSNKTVLFGLKSASR